MSRNVQKLNFSFESERNPSLLAPLADLLATLPLKACAGKKSIHSTTATSVIYYFQSRIPKPATIASSVSACQAQSPRTACCSKEASPNYKGQPSAHVTPCRSKHRHAKQNSKTSSVRAITGSTGGLDRFPVHQGPSRKSMH